MRGCTSRTPPSLLTAGQILYLPVPPCHCIKQMLYDRQPGQSLSQLPSLSARKKNACRLIGA